MAAPGEWQRPADTRALRPLRILTNTRWLDGQEISRRPVEPIKITGSPSLQRVRSLAALWRYDAAFINIDPGWTFALCALKKLIPGARFRILSIDLILPRPRGFKGYLRFLARRWLLKEVDRFVLYYRATDELRRVYSIPAHRVTYVPFKANTLDRLLATETCDEGYFLACGRSNRDYHTLCEALRGLPYRCMILAPWTEAEEHGTRVGDLEYPENVRLVSDDGSANSWNRWIARARGVILPIAPGALSPSGIGTYLVAMALGKPVIITDGPATWGMLDQEQAVLVPPSDVRALRDAITRVAEDSEYRQRIATQGHAYALSLGGEERLREDLRQQLAELVAY